MGTDCKGVNALVQGKQRQGAWRIDGRHYKKNKKLHFAKLGIQQMRCTRPGNVWTPGSNRETGVLGGEDDCMMHPAPFWNRPDVRLSGVINLSAQTLSSVIHTHTQQLPLSRLLSVGMLLPFCHVDTFSLLVPSVLLAIKPVASELVMPFLAASAKFTGGESSWATAPC